MSDENTQTNADQTNDGQVDDNQDTNDKVDITKQSDSDFMVDTVDKIKDTQKTILDEDGTDKGDDTSKEGDNAVLTDLAGHDIPDAFSDAAEAAGMSPSDIIDFADKHTDEQLMEMIPTLESSLEKPGDEQDKDKVTKQDDKTNKDKGNENIDPKLIESITEKISKQFEEKFGATLEDIDKFKANQNEQQQKQDDATISKLFDEASKESPVFGKTDELPRFPSGRLEGQLIPTSPEMKARLEVVRFANAFMGQGANIDDAMANALATYGGLHLKKEAERNVIKNLKLHEQKLGGARVGKETKKKYADTREEIIDDIKQMKREAGID